MRIYLIGYMGSGKSRVGMELAELTGYPFFDIDHLFEERYHISILDFFEKYGEKSFRNIERKLLLNTVSTPDAVISTGGGTPCFFDNMQFINQNGISVYLRMPIALLVERLIKVKKKRPLLKDKTIEQLSDYISEQLKERESFYLQANWIVDVTETGAKDILDLIPDLPRINS